MGDEEWAFSEDQRDSVCKGEVCPKCLSNGITYTGCSPDGVNVNNAYKCGSCGTEWEGY